VFKQFINEKIHVTIGSDSLVTIEQPKPFPMLMQIKAENEE